MNFKRIENVLNIELPDEYIGVINNYPFAGGLYDKLKNNLIDDENKIIDLNLKLKEKGFIGKKLPDDFFAFGQEGADSIFFLRISYDSNIYFLSKGDKYNINKINEYILYHSFDEFIEETLVLQEISEMEN